MCSSKPAHVLTTSLTGVPGSGHPSMCLREQGRHINRTDRVSTSAHDLIAKPTNPGHEDTFGCDGLALFLQRNEWLHIRGRW